MGQEPDPTPDPNPAEPTESGEAQPEAKKPWDDENFDPERAWNLTQKLRDDAKKAKQAAAEANARAKEYEDQNKTESQKLQERAETAERELAAANRSALVASVALNKGLTAAQSKRLIGDTKEELEADADELLATFTPAGGQEPSRTPRERLRPGAVPSAEEEEHDPAKLAAQIPRRYG